MDTALVGVSHSHALVFSVTFWRCHSPSLESLNGLGWKRSQSPIQLQPLPRAGCYPLDQIAQSLIRVGFEHLQSPFQTLLRFPFPSFAARAQREQTAVGCGQNILRDLTSFSHCAVRAFGFLPTHKPPPSAAILQKPLGTSGPVHLRALRSSRLR